MAITRLRRERDWQGGLMKKKLLAWCSLWWQNRTARLSEALLDFNLKQQAEAGAQVYAQEVWDRRMKNVSRVRLVSGREIQLADRLRDALTSAMARNATVAAMAGEPPLERLWSWPQLATKLIEDASTAGVLKEAGVRAAPLLSGGDWSAEIRALLLDEAGYHFELFSEDARLCRDMTETRMRSLALAREIIAESRVKAGLPSLSALSRKDQAAGETLPVVMAEWVARRAHGLPDPLENAHDWDGLARLLMGQPGATGPLRVAAPLSRQLILDYQSGAQWKLHADAYYLGRGGYSWERFKEDARECETLASRQRSDALASRSIPGRRSQSVSKIEAR